MVDKHLTNHETLLEQGFGVADIMLVTCLDWAKFYKFDLPKVTLDYHNRMKTRLNYVKARNINYA